MPRRTTPHPFYEAIGKRLRHRREALGWSLGDVVDKAGVPKGHVSNIERGLVYLRVDTLVLLVRTLGLSMNSLTNDLEVKPRNHESNALPSQDTSQPASIETPAKPGVTGTTETTRG